jgi:hypothetical protein
LSKNFQVQNFSILAKKNSLVYSSFIHLFILVSVFQNFGSFTKTLITFGSFKGGTATLPMLLDKFRGLPMLPVFVMDGFYNNHQPSTLLPLEGGG